MARFVGLVLSALLLALALLPLVASDIRVLTELTCTGFVVVAILVFCLAARQSWKTMLCGGFVFLVYGLIVTTGFWSGSPILGYSTAMFGVACLVAAYRDLPERS